MPGFGGFISCTEEVPARNDFYNPIHQPITDNAVVFELLKRSETATKEVGQPYTINTFDLGVMKACPIVWKYEKEFQEHIIIPGKYYTVMNYTGKLTGHECQGSGYSAILIETGLASSGCLKNILSGKSYVKALFNLKVVTEALERLFLNVFLEEANLVVPRMHFPVWSITAIIKTLMWLWKMPQYFRWFVIMWNTKKVRQGHLGKTGVFWFSIIQG